ncbi:MAG: TPM domain-containing protein, partial [Terracidiphilus sp.]
MAKLDRICAELDHSQTNAQVAVVTVRNLDGEDAADWANQLEDKWQMGKKGSDRGVLVLLAVDDRKYRIDVGYGLE